MYRKHLRPRLLLIDRHLSITELMRFGLLLYFGQGVRGRIHYKILQQVSKHSFWDIIKKPFLDFLKEFFRHGTGYTPSVLCLGLTGVLFLFPVLKPEIPHLLREHFWIKLTADIMSKLFVDVDLNQLYLESVPYLMDRPSNKTAAFLGLGILVFVWLNVHTVLSNIRVARWIHRKLWRRIRPITLIVALFFGLGPLAFLLSGWLRYWRARGLNEDIDFLCAIVVRGVILVAGAVGPYRLRVIEYLTNLVLNLAILVPILADLGANPAEPKLQVVMRRLRTLQLSLETGMPTVQAALKEYIDLLPVTTKLVSLSFALIIVEDLSHNTLLYQLMFGPLALYCVYKVQVSSSTL